MSTVPATDIATLTFDGRFRVPSDVFSLQKFRAWVHSDDFPEQARASFIAGKVEIEMSPENLETHNAVKGEVNSVVLRWVKEHRLGRVYHDGALLVCPKADLSTGPDGMFCSQESRRSGRVRQRERTKGSGNPVEVVGVPDLVLEVVSQGSVQKDTKLLRRHYYLAGIPEYWLIDARGRKLSFQILVCGDDGFVSVAPDSDGYRRSPVLGARFQLVRQRDELGEFEYQLLWR